MNNPIYRDSEFNISDHSCEYQNIKYSMFTHEINKITSELSDNVDRIYRLE